MRYNRAKTYLPVVRVFSTFIFVSLIVKTIPKIFICRKKKKKNFIECPWGSDSGVQREK